MELDFFGALNYVRQEGDVAYFMTELFLNNLKNKDYQLRFSVLSRMANTCRIFCRISEKSDLSREVEDEFLKIVIEEQ